MMVFGDRVPMTRKDVDMTSPVEEPLHTDTRPGNLSAAEYRAEHARRAAELGDDGLHIIPPDVIAAALRKPAG